MARRIVIAAVALAALPLVAQVPEQIADSPLVAAAKRTNRLGKPPANIITDETIAKSKGRISIAAEPVAANAPAVAAAQGGTLVPAAPSNAPAAAKSAGTPPRPAAPPRSIAGGSAVDAYRAASAPQSSATTASSFTPQAVPPRQ